MTNISTLRLTDNFITDRRIFYPTVKKGVNIILPIKKGNIEITSPYGERILFGSSGFHSGLDIIGKNSSEVVSVCDGYVLWSQIITDKSNPTWEWGNYIAISGADGNTVYYCHLAKRLVKQGQRVKAGDVIGIMGNTGYSFGTHLHFELRRRNTYTVNPSEYLRLPNASTVISEKEYYSDELCRTCGFLDGTRAYINNYAWSSDLWRKLAFLVEHSHGKELTRNEIIKECGLLPHTVKYIDAYSFASDFWSKIGKACV